MIHSDLSRIMEVADDGTGIHPQQTGEFADTDVMGVLNDIEWEWGNRWGWDLFWVSVKFSG